MDADGWARHVRTLWGALGGEPHALARIVATPSDIVLPSAYDVTNFAAACVATANLALSEVTVARGLGVGPAGDQPPAVVLDHRTAAAAFSCERLLRADSWELPPVWDPIAGDYRTSDGWVRLHTNYLHHRTAVEGVLDGAGDRDAVAAAAGRWRSDDLETAVVDAGGCAAALRSPTAWRAHLAGRATADEPPVHLVSTARGGASGPPTVRPGSQPLTGVRVLDLTRVIAGPVATRFLAAHGAEVARIDPPGFEEVAVLLPETTRGKRCAALDLGSPADRATFEELVADAHVVVGGLRPGALDGLGYGPEGLRAIQPDLVVVRHDAYGWHGPWAGRRGFDSLVQMTTGLAAAGRTDDDAPPRPLPVQALDHGTGFLLAAGACRALAELVTTGAVLDVQGSLVGSAHHLLAHPTPDDLDRPAPGWSDADLEAVTTDFGAVHQVPVPAGVAGHPPRFDPGLPPGALGRHAAAFTR